MLIIDKQQYQSRFILTLSESTNTATPNYTIAIYSPFKKSTLYVPLPANTSPYKERYDEYYVNNIEFNDLNAGLYQFEIQEQFEGVIETGMVKVIDDVVTENYEFITPDESDDDIIVYYQ